MAVETVQPVQEKDKLQEEVLLMQGDGLHCVDKIQKAKDAVCFICCNGSGSLKRGSGFFAVLEIRGTKQKCIVTNNHVIGCKEDAAIGHARFNYEGNNAGKEVALQPETLFYTDVELDYTIIGCDSSLIEHTFGILPLEFKNEPIAYPGDQIFIYQHPKGNAKQVSYERISDIKRPFVYYQADTDIGSSGSPVLRKFELLAVHSKGCDKYNKGTLCSEILYHLNYRQSKQLSISPMIECADNDRKRPSEESQGTDDSMLPKKSRVSDSIQADSEHTCRCPSNDELQKLAQECAGYWKHLGRKLGLPDWKIEVIHKDNRNYDDIVEKAYEMLKVWKERESSPTLLMLGRALKALGKNATCRSILGL